MCNTARNGGGGGGCPAMKAGLPSCQAPKSLLNPEPSPHQASEAKNRRPPQTMQLPRDQLGQVAISAIAVQELATGQATAVNRSARKLLSKRRDGVALGTTKARACERV